MNVVICVLQALLAAVFVLHAAIMPKHRVLWKEYPNVGFNSVPGILAGLIAWGCFGPYDSLSQRRRPLAT